MAEAIWLNRTIDIDTGCVFGGKLTALRYPEKELVDVPAKRTYYEPARPFLAEEAESPTLGERRDDALAIEDVLGKRIVHTRLQRIITIREENAVAALELMSRFAADPHWLIYLPPTMSPSETAPDPALLEHPAETFAYYRDRGVAQVICEEKHMGSRAVAVVCRTEEAARKRFNVHDGSAGICHTRTGRHFFADRSLEACLRRADREGTDVGRPVGQVPDGLVLSGLRADALVRQGAGAPDATVRAGRFGRTVGPGRGGGPAGRGGAAWSCGRRSGGPLWRQGRNHQWIRRCLSPLLLAGFRAR